MISLGVDIGGTGAKCVAFQEDGKQLALAYHEYPNPPSKVDLEPAALMDSVLRVLRECTESLENPREVVAITVSSFGESFVPIDAQGQPLSDIIMYFADTQSGEFDELVRQVGAERFMKITRTLPDASYSLAKMLHTRRTASRPVWKYLPIAGYVCYALCGEPATDVALACRLLLYDVAKREWSSELLQATGFAEDQLPWVCPSGTNLGPLLPELAKKLGLPPEVRVVFGTHDQIANALACGVADPGEASNGSGTTECIAPLFAGIPEEMDFIRANYACVPYPDDRGYITYAYNLSGGSVLRWFRDTLAVHLGAQARAEKISIYDVLNRASPDAPTDLLMLPFLQGKGGTPDVQPAARGLIYGLSMHTELPHLYRAVLEGISFELAYNLEALERFGIAPQRLYACGGGARSKVWLSIKADTWNREVLPLQSQETGALGSAILGFAAVTGQQDRCALAKRFVQLGEPVLPNPERAGIYAEKYQQYKTLRIALMDGLRRQQEEHR